MYKQILQILLIYGAILFEAGRNIFQIDDICGLCQIIIIYSKWKSFFFRIIKKLIYIRKGVDSLCFPGYSIKGKSAGEWMAD